MRQTVLLSFALLLCSPLSALAQELPTPPPELARFDRLIGIWEGAGTVVMEPGAPAMKWTSSSHSRKALGGFFVQEDAVIEFEGGAFGPLAFRSFFGYDAQRTRFVSIGMNNSGGTSSQEIRWVDEHTMVTSEARVEDGKAVSERWLTKLEAKGLSFLCYRAVGDGAFFVHVEGSMKPATEFRGAKLLESAAAMAPVGEEMQKLLRATGSYRMKGTYQPAPDAPKMDIAGTETLVPRFGGSVIETTVIGEGFPYEGWAAWSWNAAKGCYTSIYANNMGEVSTSEMRWVGNVLVNTDCNVMMGQPFVVRGEVEVDERGAIVAGRADGFLGTSKPYRIFESAYTKAATR